MAAAAGRPLAGAGAGRVRRLLAAGVGGGLGPRGALSPLPQPVRPPPSLPCFPIEPRDTAQATAWQAERGRGRAEGR
jgi:hypothetical protein